MTTRLTYDESCRWLQANGYLEPSELPPMPVQMPRHDDDSPLGVSFFKTEVADDAFLDLTLPRTFFGRSSISDFSFRNTDLSESRLCWNTFLGVDFQETVLSGSDLRASTFEDTRFIDADLSGADLRASDYINCDFAGARMLKTKLTRSQGRRLELSNLQRQEISWYLGVGRKAPGG